ncbi:MAG: AzlD domain-containing protein [Desulfovibrio sp.]|nr:AzlD domain-containing protein [Desulfovibrio sp.]
MSFFAEHSALIWCILLAGFVSVAPKVIPITLLKGDRLPKVARDWLSFVPVAVMAALVGPDIFFFGGRFDVSFGNLFLMAALPSIVVGCVFKNYFVTLAFGICFVIVVRFMGWY